MVFVVERDVARDAGCRVDGLVVCLADPDVLRFVDGDVVSDVEHDNEREVDPGVDRGDGYPRIGKKLEVTETEKVEE